MFDFDKGDSTPKALCLIILLSPTIEDMKKITEVIMMYRLDEQYTCNDMSYDTIHGLFVERITMLSKKAARNVV